MFVSMPNRRAQALIALCLLFFAQFSLAGVIVAGQEIGKSRWSERTRLKPAQYRLEEGFATPYQRGPVLRIKGALLAGLSGTADLFYDERGTLVAAMLTSENPQRLLAGLARQSKASRQTDGTYVLKELRMRVEDGAGHPIVRISSPTFDAAFPKPGFQGISLGTFGLAGPAWSLAGLLTAWALWCYRKKIWMRREFLADYAVAMSVVAAIFELVPVTRLGTRGMVLGFAIVGYGLMLTWALRTVRLSGWLPRKPFVELLWALPATPVLLLPVVVRNAVKSFHYAGLVAFFVQLGALAYYYFQPGLEMAFVILAAAGLISGGVVRTYCATFAYFQKQRRWHPAAAAAAVQLAWPVTLAVGVLSFGLVVLSGFFSLLLPMLLVAVVVFVVGSLFDLSWLKAAAVWLPLLGILPGIAGASMAGVAPTGYSELDFASPDFNSATGLPSLGGLDWAGNGFGSGGFDFNPANFDFNPANGMQMIGGMGGLDVFGNTYGSNWNDPW